MEVIDFYRLQDIIMDWFDSLQIDNIIDSEPGTIRIPPFIQMSPNNNITYIIGRLPGNINEDIHIPEDFPQEHLSMIQENSIRRLINNENNDLNNRRNYIIQNQNQNH